jgi:predicted O-methyltransferase YrrM
LAGIPRRELIGKSDDEDIVKAASEKTYDIIFIDGDHLYKAVKKDTQNYLPLLNENGYILYHDSLLKEWGVKRIVKELKADNSLEFIDEFISTKYKPLGLAMFRRKECK